MLYDGECPICVKEISFLKFLQRNRTGKVDFVDISLPEYDGSKYEGVDYEMAMGEMTVIDEKNKVSNQLFFYLMICKVPKAFKNEKAVIISSSHSKSM